MSYYVYILKSLKDGRYYIGSTSDVMARLKFHNSGLQRSTRYAKTNNSLIGKDMMAAQEKMIG
jgi:putative endonuclease